MVLRDSGENLSLYGHMIADAFIATFIAALAGVLIGFLLKATKLFPEWVVVAVGFLSMWFALVAYYFLK